MQSAHQWYYVKDGEPNGPMSLSELVSALPSAGGLEVLVYGPGLADWTPARAVPAVADAMSGSGGLPSVPTARRTADEIEYHIHGDDMQFAEITLDPGSWEETHADLESRTSRWRRSLATPAVPAAFSASWRPRASGC